MKMLERRGIPSTLYLGSGRDDQGQMAAHAWLRSGSYIVTGKEGHERYAVVGIFGKDTRAGDLNLKRSSDKEFYIEGSLYFIRKMRGMAGFKLYLNMGMILVISVLDGIGIYLIVPLRGHWRIRDRFERVPLVSTLMDLAGSWSLLNLPMVLALYVVIVGGQALRQNLLNAKYCALHS